MKEAGNSTVTDERLSTDDAREQFLTARQLAAILQVSDSTVRRLAQQGRIPCIRITPHIIRFHLQAVREALDGTTPRQTRTSRRHASGNHKDDSQLSLIDF
ncbi:MAG TPA: helix-turn-helix domain-containing protein [Pyrinomonadaceae bacterium]|nr:helix-turn-helix domain-containing protein [Pyrinomonadaceae bacterium]